MLPVQEVIYWSSINLVAVCELAISWFTAIFRILVVSSERISPSSLDWQFLISKTYILINPIMVSSKLDYKVFNIGCGLLVKCIAR
jgi:hypothetical protein